MSQIQPIIGHLLSKYDQTAIEGIDKIIILSQSLEVGTAGSGKGLRFADQFISEPQALEALSKFFGRPCDTAIGFRACITLLENAQQGNRAAFARYLCRQAVFGPIRKLLNSIQEGSVPSTCGCLSLMTYLMKSFPKLVLAKLNREAPIALGIYKHLTPRTASLRAYRCLFLAQFALTTFPQINEKTVTTHGYLTHLVEDAAELATSAEHSLEGPIVAEAIAAALTALREAFVVSPHLSKNAKREVLMGQRNVLRALVKWLSDENKGAEVLALLQRLVAELHEESFDYLLHRSDDAEGGVGAAAAAANASANNSGSAEAYMPNFSLLAILRLLKPKSYVLHTRLVVFILQKSPDLLRPYFTRVAQHLFEEDRTVSKTNHFAAVVNIMCRVACCPIPTHLADPAVAVINTTAEANTFFTLTPKGLAEEVCPRGLGEFVHRMINKSDNCLHLLMALQVTYAVLRRAEEALACARVILNTNADKVSAVDAETFLAAAEHELREHLPRTEEFWHRLTQQLLPIASTPKAQYLLQRMYLVVKRYAEVFRLRTPWISAVPPVVADKSESSSNSNSNNNNITSVGELMKALANPVLGWDGKSVSCLCALLLSNLTMNVPLTKLHHITLGGDSSNNNNNSKNSNNNNNNNNNNSGGAVEAAAKEWPALLSLINWFIAHKGDSMSGEVVEAKGFIVQLVLWCVHGVSLRFGATAAEVYAWLSELTPETAPVLLHLLNNLLQQSLSKAADRVAELLMKSEHGVLHASAGPFVARVREKMEEKRSGGNSGATATTATATATATATNNVWQIDLQKNIDAFEGVAKKVAKKWSKAVEAYEREVEAPMGEQLALQVRCLSGLRVAALQAREAADADIPASAHLVRYLLNHQDPSRYNSNNNSSSSKVSSVALPPFAAAPEERGGSALLAALERLDDPATAACVDTINAVFKDLCKAALTGGDDEATEAFLAEAMSTPYAAHTIARAFMDVARAVNATPTASTTPTPTNDESDDAATVAATVVVSVPKYVSKFIGLILAALADGTGALAKMTLSGDEQSSGFALALAAAAALTFHHHNGLVGAKGEEEESASLVSAAVTIAKNYYSGSLSVVDRALYAAMLMLELAAQERKKRADAASAPTGKNAPTAFSLAGHALVALRQARYCVGRMATASASAPEADALGQLVDGWSDAEIQALALSAPLKLSNTVRLAVPAAVPNVLRAMFPDVGHVSEYELQGRTRPSVHASSAADGGAHLTTDDAAATAADAAATASEARLVDPRFMLPLLRTTAAMCAHQPTAVPSHWIVRCAPFAMAAMSSTDASVRKEASTTFALISNLSGGYVRSVFQFLRLKYSTNNYNNNNNNSSAAVVPRVPAPLTAFLISAMLVVRSPDHPLHNAVVNQFITPAASSGSKDKDGPQVLSNPCPMAHLLTEFPLECIVGEQLLSKQEDSFRQGTTVDSGTTAEAAKAITNKLRAEHPPHIDFILRQLRHSCVTKADVEDLVAANVPSNLFLLAGLVRGAPKTRLRVVKTITDMATSTREVAEQWVVNGSVRVVEWALFFLLTLASEAEGEGQETTRHKQCVAEMSARICAMLRDITVACGANNSAAFSPDLSAQYAALARQFLATRLANSQAVGGVLKGVVAMWEHSQ